MNKCLRSLASIFFVVFPLQYLCAQTADNALPAAGESAPAAIKDSSYLLGPEDQIAVHVVDLDDISADKPVRLDPNGYIELPLVGRFRAAGLTVEQLREGLAAKLSKYIDSPQITINVLEFKSQPVSILGAVNNPGLHQLQGPKRLLDVISLAGGLRQDAGQKVTITRQMKWGALPLAGSHPDPSGQYSIADVQLNGLTDGKHPAENIAVRANDVISVSRTEMVYVVGEVKRAGSISLNTDSSISLLRALSMAEGPTHDAAPRKARILRGGDGTVKTDGIPVDVAMVMAGKLPDPELRPNDILFIPNNVPASAMRRAAEAAIQIATGVMIYHH